MNLFDLFSNFCKLISQIEIDTKTQALYFNLLNIFNENYFASELVIKTIDLLELLHIDKRALYKARKELQRLNIIKYKQTSKFLIGTYALVNQSEWCISTPLLVHFNTTTGAFQHHSLVQSSTTSHTRLNNNINKLSKHKREKVSINCIDINNTHAHAQENEFLSQKQLKFANAFPNKTIDCTIPERIDIDLLIKKIQQSEFLSNCTNLTLKSYVKLYEQIVNDKYKDFKKKSKALNFEQRTYTQKDFDKLFDNLREVKI